MPDPEAPSRTRLATLASVVALVVFACVVVLLSAGPHSADDLWFHLRMGETFAQEGPWPGHDPIVYTAHDGDPVQHEWLFDVLIHAVDRVVGLGGLRVVHALGVALTIALVFSIFRRETRSLGLAAAATCIFLSLGWWRLVQLRPDLWTIPATLVLYALLLAPERPPSWPRVAGAAALLGLWANAHSAFLAGLALILAALLGCVVRIAVARVLLPASEASEETRAAGPRAARLAAALAAGFAATLLNPRGLGQHLTYFSMRSGSALPALDDWTPYRPWLPLDVGAAGPLEWGAMNGVLAVFLLATIAGGVRLWLGRTRADLDRVDPVRFGLGAAAIVAMAMAVRFVWLGFLPLVFALRVALRSPAARGRAAPWLHAAAATAAVALLTGFLVEARYARFTVVHPAAWAAGPYASAKYHPESIRFLADTGVRGHAFTPYHLGAFLGYWLAPGVQVFVDGRNEAVPPEIVHELGAVQARRGLPGESVLELLDRREVDVFFGVGLPLGLDPSGVTVYTTALLDGAPGWIPVFRTPQQALYLRRNERNRENLERIADWYADQGVPFDREAGLDAARVLAERPDWATRHGMAPLDLARLRAAASSDERGPRLAALDRLAWSLGLLGAYEAQLELDEAIVAEAPRAGAALRRRVWALMQLDRPDEAVSAARELARALPADPRTKFFTRAAGAFRRERRRPDVDRLAAGRWIDALPVLTPSEVLTALAGRYAAPPELYQRRDAAAPPDR